MLEDALLSNPAWSTLTAVREGRFVVLDRDLFHLRPNGRWAEAYETIYEIVYEDPKY
jgi:iron complex transport system substrate-binding protein